MSTGSVRARRRRRGRGTLLAELQGRFLERALARISERPRTKGNTAELLVDGSAAYPAMLELIRCARRRIHFENYIIRDDEAGALFADALLARAREGLEVRVLYDWLGSFGTDADYWNALREGGCEVRPFGRALSRGSANLLARDHRKLLVTDGRAAIMGGLCIGEEWGSLAAGECWRDTAVLLRGPCVRELDRTFAHMWVRAGGEAIATLSDPRSDDDDDARVSAAGRGAEDVAVRVVDGRPGSARAFRLYQFLATVAERSLYLTMAYPILPTTLRRSLASAARAGVDVRMLVPSTSDLPVVNQAARATYGSLLGAGVRLYQWMGPMLHAKTAVADGRLSVIGSTNLEAWGLQGNYELDVELESEPFGQMMVRQFMSDLEQAEELRYPEWRRRPWLTRARQRAASALLWLPMRVHSG
ncbi:MAG TPA: phosphatidylserine/phosphatidylglycerophosphate/cardiolipin synthase family protein [Longimicrobiales bacterium]|nr:phosphatidylserine/phosphatidylglycerophosphate/cardiolipin synthase family protein [Longimicrobiales bacterium]